jgi:hypothetical protein
MARLSLSACALAAALVALLPTAPAAAAPIVDPVGDTFGSGAPIDVTGLSAALGAGGLTLTMTFNGVIAAPSATAANSVLGFIDLDTDQNAATAGGAPWGSPVPGGNNWINFFASSVPGPLVALGDEFYVDLGSELFHPGAVDVVNTATNAKRLVGISYGASSLSLTIALALLGGDDGNVNFGALVGNFVAPTDRVPNGTTPGSTTITSTDIPEPGTLMLGALAGAMLLASSRRGRLARID